MNGVLQAALIVGGLWGAVEVVFTYVIGLAPTRDVFETFLTPVAASLLCHAFFFSVGKVRPHRVFDVLTTAGVLLAPVAFLIRGFGQFVPLNLLGGLLPIAVCLFLIARETKKPSEPPWTTPIRVFWIQAAFFGAALGYAFRADRQGSITSVMLLSAAGFCLAIALLAATVVFFARRFAGVALLVMLAGGSFALAKQRGSGPPRYPTEAGALAQTTSEKGRPNVLLIVLDTVRADHLDLYGYERPTFSATSHYLKDGLVFDRVTSSGTFSLTSHASLFTGLLPSAHGARPVIGGEANYSRLWPDIETMASFFRGRGYRTAGVSANDIFLGAWTGLQKGFDTFSATGLRSLRFVSQATLLRRMLIRTRFIGRRITSNTWSATQVTDAAIDITDQPREPFFLFLNYFDAHEPHVVMGSPPWIKPGAVKPIDAYDSEIAKIDFEVARLLRSLEERGQLDRTLVILAADHGEYFNERGLRGHPAVSYETSTHVPLALRLPGVLTSGRTGRRTGLHEVFKMVKDVLDKNSLDWLREIDLSPRILNESWSKADFGTAPPADGRPSTTAVFEGNLKLLHHISGRSELYDVEADPKEERNLIDSTDPRLVAAREQMLKQVMLRATRPPGPVQPLSEDAKERLRALGYLR